MRAALGIVRPWFKSGVGVLTPPSERRLALGGLISHPGDTLNLSEVGGGGSAEPGSLGQRPCFPVQSLGESHGVGAGHRKCLVRNSVPPPGAGGGVP